MRRWICNTAFLLVLASAPAGAVVIASGDGKGNTTAPVEDPGFANVGTIRGTSAVYLGRGWVVTAGHIGSGAVQLGGRSFAPRPGSEVTLSNPDGSRADLLAFQLAEDPGLPALELARETPKVGTQLLMVGNGLDRGAATNFFGRPGWQLASTRTLRWGTNVVSQVDADFPLSGGTTRTFFTDFSIPGTQHEAQAAPGDSGGAVFAWTDKGWALAGVMVAVLAPFQPDNLVLAGNLTLAADLARYRPQLVAAGVLPQDATPQIHVANTWVFLGLVRTGDTRELRLPIENQGSAPLTITAVKIVAGDSSGFDIGLPASLPIHVASQEQNLEATTVDLTIRFSPTRRAVYYARLAIESNDPTRPVVYVDLYGVGSSVSWWR